MFHQSVRSGNIRLAKKFMFELDLNNVSFKAHNVMTLKKILDNRDFDMITMISENRLLRRFYSDYLGSVGSSICTSIILNDDIELLDHFITSFIAKKEQLNHPFLKELLEYYLRFTKSMAGLKYFANELGFDLFFNVSVSQESVMRMVSKHPNKAELIPFIINQGYEINGTWQLELFISDCSLETLEYLWKQYPNVNLAEVEIPLYKCLARESCREPQTLFDTIKFLVSKGANVNEVESEHGKTPLMEAVNLDMVHLAEYLIKQGADMEIKDNSGQTTMFYVKSHEMVELLIKHNVNVNVKDGKGQTPLFDCSEAQSNK